MKNILFLFPWLFTAIMAYSQTVELLDAKIDSMKNSLMQLQVQYDNLVTEVKELEKLKIMKIFDQMSKEDTLLILAVKEPYNLYDGEPLVVKPVCSTSRGDTVVLVDYYDVHSYFKVLYKYRFLYANDYRIKLNWEQMQKPQSLLERFMNKAIAKRKMAEEIAASKLKAVELKKKEAELENRSKELTRKYGKTIANKILAKEIWIGMEKEVAIQSWGEPDEVNRTLLSGLVLEQWVYGDTYLYFENGVLTSIQD